MIEKILTHLGLDPQPPPRALMGGMVSRRINARFKPTDCPRIVGITANTQQGDREAGIAAGMGDDVTTSIRVDAWVKALSLAKARL